MTMPDRYLPFSPYAPEFLGVPEPELQPEVEETLPPQSLLERVLGGFSGLESQPLGFQPRGFGEGLAVGFTRGLGGAATRAQLQREKLQRALEKRSAEREEANLKATAEHRAARMKAGMEVAGEQRKARGDIAKWERDNPPATPELLQEKPWLARQGIKVGDPVPRETFTTPPPREPVGPKERTIPVTMADGTVQYMSETDAKRLGPIKQPPKAKPVTGQERQNLAFYQRAAGSVDDVTRPYSDKGESLEQVIAKQSLPSQWRGKWAWNPLKTPAQRHYHQAIMEFTLSFLRKETGAVISKREYEDIANTYFAAPGDDDETIRRKRIARERAINGLKRSAGPALKEFEEGPQTSGEDPYQTYLRLVGESE